MNDPQLVLASESPRRQELLRQLGLRFSLCAPQIEESPGADEAPADYARRVALDKARAGAAACGTALPVLGADTDVVLDGRVLGKPRDRDDAVAMLCALSDREHEVHCAVALVWAGGEATRASLTRVRFGPLSPALAEAYWRSGEPRGKAGAYAIQGLGAQFVRELKGSYSGVVGLPLYETCELLRLAHVAVPPLSEEAR